MSRIRFIHAADLHLDSPLTGLRSVDENTASHLHRASRRAVENLVHAALENQVAAVVIAGDLFDGPVKDASAGLWIESQFKRLLRERIAVVLIRGNHDAISNARRVIHWPNGVYELRSDRPESVILEQAGLAIHGQSFEARAETNDLAASYPDAVQGFFNIGVLHTSLSGSTMHDCYAPTSVAVLESKGYQYWALGHIHQRTEKSLSEFCWIGYSGNTQGRHVRESGPKGCYLVEVNEDRLPKMDFISTDSLRWHILPVDLSNAQRLGDIEDLVEQAVEGWMSENSGMDSAYAIRLQFEGDTKIHAELTQTVVMDRLTENLSGRTRQWGELWLESIKVKTRPEKASSGVDIALPVKYLAMVADEFREDALVRRELWKELDELLKKVRVELNEVGFPLLQDSQRENELNQYLAQAEDLVVSRLSHTGEA